MYLLDTDILLNLMSRAPSTSLVARLAMVAPDKQFTSSVSFGETVYGAYKQADATDNLLSDLEGKIIPNMGILDFDTAAARHYGILKEYLQRVNLNVSDTDARIAAIALNHGLTLLTGQTSRFQGIPGSRTEDWLAEKVSA